MILNVISAEYVGEYKVKLLFDNGVRKLVDLKDAIFNDRRAIFEPLRQKDFFKDFDLKFNTITWQNEADFAPEFLYELGSLV
jgi:hypothetical protein